MDIITSESSFLKKINLAFSYNSTVLCPNTDTTLSYLVNFVPQVLENCNKIPQKITYSKA